MFDFPFVIPVRVIALQLCDAFKKGEGSLAEPGTIDSLLHH